MPLTPERIVSTVDRPDEFFLVFAICFPAFTGLTAGVGLSGDLRDSRRSIPAGTLAAVALGFVVYLLAALKLAVGATPDDLASDQLIMTRIAIWGPIIPIGLAAATLSSALGSILIAPRTLQAVAADGLLPSSGINRWLSQTSERNGEPIHAVLVTSLLAVGFSMLGDIDFVAQVISMFFMVSYGAICLISTLEHFAAEPSYRPSFRSRWYLSLLGACCCVWLMFMMDAIYAVIAILVLAAIYRLVRNFSGEKHGLASLLRSAGVQLTRRLQVTLQTTQSGDPEATWRPAAVCLSEDSFERTDAFEFMRWLAHRYGFATYIHLIVGYLSRATRAEAQETLHRLIELVEFSESNVYVDTIVSPSYSSAVAQLVQIPGISGQENNLILFEFPRDDRDQAAKLLTHFPMAVAAGFDVAILASSPRRFGYQRQLHVWLTPDDFENANLMILLAYIISGHPSWARGEIKIFAISRAEDAEGLESGLRGLLKEGRLPIAPSNVEVVTLGEAESRRGAICRHSASADLTIVGLRPEMVKQLGAGNFDDYESLGAILFLTAQNGIDLDRVLDPPPTEPEADETNEPVVFHPGEGRSSD